MHPTQRFVVSFVSYCPKTVQKVKITQPGSTTVCQKPLALPVASSSDIWFFPSPLQGAAADEPHGLAAGTGWEREAGACHAQLLWAVPQDLYWRSGAEVFQGKFPLCLHARCSNNPTYFKKWKQVALLVSFSWWLKYLRLVCSVS